MVKRFVQGTIVSTLLLSFALHARANDLPTKTNPNLIHFGYYDADGRHGNFLAETFPYTNLHNPGTLNVCEVGPAAYLAAVQASLTAAFNAGKDIYATLVNESACGVSRSDIIPLMAPVWSKVKYVEVLHEPSNMSAANVDAAINLLRSELAAAGLPDKPYGIMQSACAASNGAACPNDWAAKTASLLSYVGIEAYVEVTQTAADQLNLINAAKAATPVGKSIVLVGMGFDRNLANVDPRKLRSFQKAVYLAAYNDPRVVAVTIFSYGRHDTEFKAIGGVRLHPEMKIAHYQMAERILGFAAPAFPVNHRAYLAEGSQNGFFSTAIALANPNQVHSHARVRLRAPGGVVGTAYTLLPPYSRTTVYPEDIASFASSDFSIEVESNEKLAVERVMRWDTTGYGLHLETGVGAPTTSWYLAEGNTAAFSTYYLLSNPGAATANVTVTYLRPAPAPPLAVGYTVPGNSRLTIDVNGVAGLGGTDVSGVISSTQAIVAERAMYYTGSGPAFRAGTAAIGVSSPSPSWFFAEGSTGGFYEMYVLVANPTSTATTVRATYLRPSGPPIVIDYPVAANSRYTINVDSQPNLSASEVSVKLETLNGVGIVAERTMWWEGATWYEGHTSAGATVTGTAWAVGGAEAGLTYDSRSYVLIANTGTTAGTATVMLMLGDGNCKGTPCVPIERQVNLPAQSRTSLDIRALFATALLDRDGNFVGRLPGVRVQSSGVPIVVEHSLYAGTNPSDGRIFSAGGNALATRLF